MNDEIWQEIDHHAARLRGVNLNSLFEQDAQRFEYMTFRLPGLLADTSKNVIDKAALDALHALARATGVAQKRDAMFGGEAINTTESRAVLHTALRAGPEAVITVDEKNIMPGVHDTLARMRDFTDAVRSGKWRGHSGQEITDIVNIGIGGSSLGPELATQALTHWHHPRLSCHFVANVEASDLAVTLASLSPETTLFIVASKTFTTAETMQNAHLARDWLLAHYKNDESAVARHFVAASTNAESVKAFGIAPENMFPFSDWVGGRYSLWSSIGLSVMLMTGADAFDELLAGARAMDDHFRQAPLEENLPVRLALLGLWYRNCLRLPAHAVIPYHKQLGRLPAFLQQLDMESNGKAVTLGGQPVDHITGPIIFGEPGTDAQHSFFQWLHQSPDVVPVDIIAAVTTPYGSQAQQDMLLSNALAQAEALMTGKESTGEPHRHFTGNRPTTTILLDALTPRTLGMLLALYEHKVFVQGAIWGINSFDQWGVELGKVLAKKLQEEIATGQAGAHDPSTLGLMAHVAALRKS